MYYNFEVKNGNERCYVEQVAWGEANQVLGIKLGYNYLDSWHTLNTNQLNSLIQFLSTGEFPELYTYYDCINPEADPIDRVYSQISRYAIITAQEAPPTGFTVNIYGTDLDAFSVQQYS